MKMVMLVIDEARKEELEVVLEGAGVAGYTLKSQIEVKIQLAGVKQFSVAIVDTAESGPGRVVGHCGQGTKKLLAIGASVDTQKEYHSYGADIFYEQPLNQGRQGLTLQLDFVHFDGATSLSSLPRQNTYLLEAGVHLARGRFTPFVQYASRDLGGASPGRGT